MNLAIIGASGNVGRKTIEILEKSKLSLDNLFLVASLKSAGEKITFKGKEIEIENLENYDFSKAQITFFAAGSLIAKEWAPKAAKKTIVIDNSSYFRMQNDVPLVVPEVNPEALDEHKNIIANPNCSTMQMVLVLKPLHDEYKIKRVIVSTYQAVSGAGKAAMDELFEQTKNYLDGKKIVSKNFSKQIAFNLIPHIDEFNKDGYTKEELKMTNETKKILDEKINVSATCVRVPVKTGHSESINIEFENSYDLENIKKILEQSPGCKVIDEHKEGGYITPIEAEGDYTTYISRIRKDNSNEKAINLWVVSDNLLKGAALNTVQIAERLMKKLKN
ncbi:aspartate-semialdehyde dehydrogenase [Pelagibacteraceae bacterium]|nr:aspartate-semialdehyde dehydrogenase [Pelagibacteraceae bacterium]MDC0339529.1 aspartate-semialdehyde dehydrogenase [Pelagibacteraceae bacterium]MDC0366103.1 aspartate-semialdehyde dehydrogenase [Pelagibacteraceae bacterium]